MTVLDGVTLPTRPEEMDDFLGDPINVKKLMSTTGAFKDFIGSLDLDDLEKNQ